MAHDRREQHEQEQKELHSKIAAFMPPLLLVATFIVAFLARSPGSASPAAGASAPATPPIVGVGWLAISAIIPWILLVFLIFGALVLLYGLLNLAGWFSGSRGSAAPDRPEQGQWLNRNWRMLLGSAAVGLTLLLLLGATIKEGWYEYRWADSPDDIAMLVNRDGWQVAPDQPAPTFLRRSRLAALTVPPSPVPQPATTPLPGASPVASPGASPEASPVAVESTPTPAPPETATPTTTPTVTATASPTATPTSAP